MSHVEDLLLLRDRANMVNVVRQVVHGHLIPREVPVFAFVIIRVILNWVHVLEGLAVTTSVCHPNVVSEVREHEGEDARVVRVEQPGCTVVEQPVLQDHDRLSFDEKLILRELSLDSLCSQNIPIWKHNLLHFKVVACCKRVLSERHERLVGRGRLRSEEVLEEVMDEDFQS